MLATLFTIGYQGANLEQVVASLAGAGVSVLVDTRETPISPATSPRSGRTRAAHPARRLRARLPALLRGRSKACHRSLLAHEIEGLLDVATVHLRPGRTNEPDDDEGLMALGQVAHNKVQVAVG